MNKIIAFSGTHGTGKSTCAYSLAANYKLSGKSVVVLDELARECPLKINKEADDLTQYWILSSQIKKEIKLMGRYDYVICDRAIVDTIAYGITLGVLHSGLVYSYLPYILKYYKDIYLLDPYIFNYQKDDGIRDMDKEFRLQVHHNLMVLYDTYSIPHTLINSQEKLDDSIKV